VVVRQENKKQKRKKEQKQNKNEEEMEKSMYFVLFSPYVFIVFLYNIRRVVFLMEMLCFFCDVETEFLCTCRQILVL